MKPVRAAIYLRVSTADQNTDLQRRETLAFATARGWADIAIYEDKATGTNANRPELKRLIKDTRERRVDVVICWKLDRLFRSLKDLIATLNDWQELGVEFISLKDNIDLTTSSGRLLMHLLGAFGEFEASLIRERVKAGLANARAQGKRLGRPKVRDDNRIGELRRQGLSIRAIAKALHVSTTAVQRGIRVTKSPSNPKPGI